jgi:hypothetical protein
VVVSLFSRICFVYDLVCIDLKILIGAMGFSFFLFFFFFFFFFFFPVIDTYTVLCVV